MMTKDRIMSNLNTKVWSRSIVFAIVLALLLFVPAGTIEYWQAWVYLVVFFASSVAVTIYLMNKDPALLMRRMKAGPTAEREKTQKIIMFFAMVSFVTIFLVSALDYRFMWSPVPLAVVIGGDIVVALGFFITFLVVKENTFASATIEITKDQSVISTGAVCNCASSYVQWRITNCSRHTSGSWLIVGFLDVYPYLNLDRMAIA